LGKGREEDNVPASHGNERETELTLPYGYRSCEEEERNGRKRKGERRKKRTIKRLAAARQPRGVKPPQP
jgi:hypothetical protein